MSLLSGIIVEKKKVYIFNIYTAVELLASRIQLQKFSDQSLLIPELNLKLHFLLFNTFYSQRTFNK